MSNIYSAVRAALIVSISAAAVLAGCAAEQGPATGSDSDATEAAANSKDVGGLSLEGFESFHPQGDEKTYYTGYDGKNKYVAPIAFFADEPPTVTFGDPTVAEMKGEILTVTRKLVPDLPKELDGRLQLVMVQSLKAGKTTIIATSGSIKETATLNVTQYTASDVEIGEKRYMEGQAACTNCHADLGVHNPTVLVDLSDETILGIAVGGKSIEKISPETGQKETLKPNRGNHKWTVTDEERVGLMAFLRSRKLTFQMP